MIAPGGCLVFFPSYKLMEKLQNRWSETGQWSRLNARKSLFVGKIKMGKFMSTQASLFTSCCILSIKMGLFTFNFFPCCIKNVLHGFIQSQEEEVKRILIPF